MNINNLKVWAADMGLVLCSRSALADLAYIINERSEGVTVKQEKDGNLIINIEDLDNVRKEREQNENILEQ